MSDGRFVEGSFAVRVYSLVGPRGEHGDNKNDAEATHDDNKHHATELDDDETAMDNAAQPSTRQNVKSVTLISNSHFRL